MALSASEDPARVERYEVKHRRLREVLALAGVAVFVVVGVWMLFAPDVSIVGRGAGLLSASFFGWCGVVVAQRMRRGGSVLLTREGLYCGMAPTYDVRRLVRWADIKDFAIATEANQELNVV